MTLLRSKRFGGQVRLLVMICGVAGGVFAQTQEKREPGKQLYERYLSLGQEVKNDEEILARLKKQAATLIDTTYAKEKKAILEYFDERLKTLGQGEIAATQESIDTLERFLRRHPNHPELTPNAIFILGGLLFEKQEMAVAGPQEEEEFSGELYGRTTKLYEELVKKYPNYRMLDVVYYMLGICYFLDGNTEQALHAWHMLVERYPNSSLSDEVWFRIGNLEFEKDHFRAAVAAYLHITERPTSPYYDKAAYKLAWTYYLQNRFNDAIDGFAKVLDLSYSQGRRNESLLASESVSYMAICFVDRELDATFKLPYSEEEREAGTATVMAAQAYFAKIGSRGYERDVLLALADLLLKAAKFKGAVSAYEKAIELDPLHIDNIDIQEKIVKVYEDAHQSEQVMMARQRLVQQFLQGSGWDSKYAKDKAVVAKANELVKRNLLALAISYHEKANHLKKSNTKNSQEYYQKASDAYADYIRHDASESNIDKIYFYYAESSFDAGNYLNAILAYEQVRDWPFHTDYRTQAALNTVYAYEKEIARMELAGELPKVDLTSVHPKDIIDGQAIPTVLLGYIQAIDNYVRLQPKEPVTVAFLYRAAATYYVYHQDQEARTRFMQLIDEYPATDIARVAANLLLEDSIEKNAWGNVVVDAEHFRDLDVGKRAFEFQKIALSARFKVATTLLAQAEESTKLGMQDDAKQQYEQTAAMYLQLLQDDPKAEFADKMLFNAAKALEKSGALKQSSDLFARLFFEFPASSLAAEAAFQSARILESEHEFAKAASLYLEISSVAKQPDLRAQALLNAAILFEADQNYEEAAKLFEQYANANTNTKVAEARDALWRAAGLMQKANQQAYEARLLYAFIARYSDKQIFVQFIARAYERLLQLEHDAANKDKLNKKIIVLAQKTKDPSLRALGAQIRYTELMPQMKRYTAMAIQGKTGARQKKELEAKSALLGEVKKQLESIIKTYQIVEWNVASLLAMGDLYESLFQSLNNAPCPEDVANIADDACDEYRNLLDDKAFVIEEKALDTYRLALKIAREAPIVVSSYSAIQAAIEKLRPLEIVPGLPLAPIFDVVIETQDKQLGLIQNWITQGRLEAAELILEDILQENPKNTDARILQASVMQKMQRYQDAEILYSAVLQDDPHHEIALQQIAQIRLALGKGKEDLERLLAVFPASAKAHVLLGNVLWRELEVQKAEEHYLEALRLDDELFAAYFNLGMLYASDMSGKLPESDRLAHAIENLERYLSGAKPTGFMQQKLERDLNILRVRLEKEKAKASQSVQTQELEQP